jgi:hypothetical protein
MTKLKMDGTVSSTVLQTLLDNGTIGYGDIVSVIISNPPDSIKEATNIFHSTMCDCLHGEEGCSYYTEETLDDTWRRDAHTEWVKNTLSTLDFFSMQTEDMMNAIDAAISIMTTIHKSKYGNFIMYYLRRQIALGDRKKPQALASEEGETPAGG